MTFRSITIATLVGAACIEFPPDERHPLNGALQFDPNRPLLLVIGDGHSPNADARDWRDRISIRAVTEETELPYLLAESGNRIAICAVGGLETTWTYEWVVDSDRTDSTNVLRSPSFELEGSWTFTTAADSELPVIYDDFQCADYLTGTDCCWGGPTFDTAATR